ncbi:5'-nucleotidase [Armillaria mellea]|nr:5'-nucleotidase [Armillaria mellea]
MRDLASKVPYPSNSSLLSLFAELATPYALSVNNGRADIPNYILVNSGSQHFDIYAGMFTKNDQLTASLFMDIFFYIPEVPWKVAYVTNDSCLGVGDDVIYMPLPFYSVPDFIGSNPPDVSNDTLIDFVFVDFVVDQVVETLNIVQSDKEYTSGDVATWQRIAHLRQPLGIYALSVWN